MNNIAKAKKSFITNLEPCHSSFKSLQIEQTHVHLKEMLLTLMKDTNK